MGVGKELLFLAAFLFIHLAVPGAQGIDVSYQDALDMIQGLSGWTIDIQGVEYFCYAYRKEKCKKMIGRGRWEIIPEMEQGRVPGNWLLDRESLKVFCKARDKSECRGKHRAFWKTVLDWNDKNSSADDKPTRPPGKEAIDRTDALDLIQGLKKWSTIMNGVEYFCYAISVSKCKKSFGGHNWKQMPNSKNIPGPFLVDEGGAKIICNAPGKSRCRSKGGDHWATIRNWDARDQDESGESFTSKTPRGGGAVDLNDASDMIQGLYEWSTIIDGKQYLCYSISVDNCENLIGGGHWKRTPKLKKDYHHVPSPFVIDGSDAKIFCKAPNKYQCETVGDFPWTWVPGWVDEPQIDTNRPTDFDYPNKNVSGSDALDLTSELEGWTGWDANGSQYFCYSLSVDTCKETIADGEWIPIQKTDEIGGHGSGPVMFVDRNDAKIFCKPVRKYRCISKDYKQWSLVTGWPDTNPDEKPWIIDANYRGLVKETMLFCKASSKYDCPFLPPNADLPWTNSNGEGAREFFRGFPEFSLDEELTDAHCPT